MNLHWIDWSIIAAFLILSLVIGLRYRKKASGGIANFFLGGRNLPWYIAGLSMVATTFAADTPLAVTELTAENGIAGNWFWWNFLIGGLLTTFFFARLWRRSGVVTEIELLELRYSGKPAAFLRGFKSVYLGVFMNCLVIAWVNNAMATLLTVFFGLDMTIALFWVGGLMIIATFYSSLSGLLGVAITDAVQFFIAIIGCIVLAILVLNSGEVGGMEEMKATLDESYFNVLPHVSNDTTVSEGNGFTSVTLTFGAMLAFVGMQWWASWYPGAEPGGGGYVVQRMNSTRSETDALKATLFFQIAHYCLRPWPWIIVALCAIMLYSPDLNHQDHQAVILANEIKGGIDENALGTFYLSHPEIEKNAVTSEYLISGIKDDREFLEAFPEYAAEFDSEKRLRETVGFTFASKLGYAYVMKDYLPIGLKGLLLAAFLAAYMSTISTQINWGASFLVNDLYARFMRPSNRFPSEEKAQKNYVGAARIASVLIMIIGFIVAFNITSISQVWGWIMEFGAGIGLVLILRWYWSRINAWSEIAATLAPVLGFFIFMHVGEEMAEQSVEWYDWYTTNKMAFIFNIAFTTVTWLLVTLFTRRESDQTLAKFYKKVRPSGGWNRVARQNGLKVDNKPLAFSFAAWFSSISMVYGILFTIGFLILQEPGKLLIPAIMSIAGLIGLIASFKFLYKNSDS
jgi:SSS family solute:Na+ symporter